ncbi:prenyltransferase [Halomonas sp. 328]|uniref:prenyltransferase n=1 Tax=Halomonas sp. 328 TaxID=2776704 RepID=UPI0018A6E448|nr:prenyltransferase [Halomonas sp. 328]MBF8221126.1 prenyltransferase [Halomonas sp. 328]
MPPHALAVLQASRPNFLILAPLCAGLGLALLLAQGGEPSGPLLALVLVAALLGQAAVNWLNEYEDFRSGLDHLTRRTPFSGGSGALPARPEAARSVLMAGLVALVAVVAIGAYLLWLRGGPLLVLGLLGVALVVGYTRWITRHPWLCLVAPGLGFGPVMVLGGLLALGGRVDGAALLVAAYAGCWVSALLLLNQFPDIDADRQVGRHHLPIARGREVAARWAQGLLLATPLLLLIGLLGGALPPSASLGLLPLPALLWVVWQLPRRLADGRPLEPLLATNVVVLLGSLALLGIGLSLG